jgi:Tfp pilus assembly protein PilV
MTNKQEKPEQVITRQSERGFTLIETACALVVMMVGALAMSSLFVFAAQNNMGGSERALAMAVAQQQLEQLRSVSFSDATLIAGTFPPQPVRSAGHDFTVVKRIEDLTNADGSPKFLKRITISVTSQAGGAGWIRTPVILVSHRSSGAMGTFAAN